MGLKEFLQSVDDTLNKFGESVSGVVDKMNTGSENFNQSMSGAMDRMGDSLQNTWDNMTQPKSTDGQASVPNMQPTYGDSPSAPIPPSDPVAPVPPVSPMETQVATFCPQPIKQPQVVEGTSVSSSVVNNVEGPLDTNVSSSEVKVDIKKSSGVSIKKEV